MHSKENHCRYVTQRRCHNGVAIGLILLSAALSVLASASEPSVSEPSVSGANQTDAAYPSNTIVAAIKSPQTTIAPAQADNPPLATLSYNISGSNSWYPYFIANNPEHPGIISEILPLLLKLAHIQGHILALPPKRTNQALETGLLDFDVVSPSWFENQDLGEAFIQSAPIMGINEYIITLPENAKNWQYIQAIKGQEVGTVRGYLYHDDNEFTRSDFTSEKELIKALHRKRIKLAISGNYPALYWSSQLNMPIALAAQHSSGNLVIRLRKQHQDLLPALDKAIAELKASGQIDAIINRYTQPFEDLPESKIEPKTEPATKLEV